MNGLERLRALGARLEGLAVERATVTVDGKPLWRVLLDIAGQIECEQVEAVAWVREHGGLEPIKSSLSALELLAEGIEIDTGLAFYDESPKERCVALRNEVKSRLMPEGMEWPCFDDGEPVRIGDEYADTFGANTVATIEFGDGYSAINSNTPGGYVVGKCEGAHGRYVPRPAPKVLDAVGVEIRVGDEVWDVDGSGPFIVSGFVGEPLAVIFEITECNDLPRKPSQLTHRAPVLAADGRPLREGETVYKVGGDGTAYVFDGMSDNVDGFAMLHHHGKPYIGTGLRVDQLTHERPDSWERIEADCMQDAKDYCEEHGIEPEYPKHIGKAKCEDLVRRAKALAERGQ